MTPESYKIDLVVVCSSISIAPTSSIFGLTIGSYHLDAVQPVAIRKPLSTEIVNKFPLASN